MGNLKTALLSMSLTLAGMGCAPQAQSIPKSDATRFAPGSEDQPLPGRQGPRSALDLARLLNRPVLVFFPGTAEAGLSFDLVDPQHLNEAGNPLFLNSVTLRGSVLEDGSGVLESPDEQQNFTAEIKCRDRWCTEADLDIEGERSGERGSARLSIRKTNGRIRAEGWRRDSRSVEPGPWIAERITNSGRTAILTTSQVLDGAGFHQLSIDFGPAFNAGALSILARTSTIRWNTPSPRGTAEISYRIETAAQNRSRSSEYPVEAVFKPSDASWTLKLPDGDSSRSFKFRPSP